MKKLLTFVAVGEALTGVMLIIAPSLAAQLLFGAAVEGAGAAMSRVAGVALVGLGVACFPGPGLVGMLVYGAGVMLLLVWLAVAEGTAGVLLWPAVLLHVVLTVLLARGLSLNVRQEGTRP